MLNARKEFYIGIKTTGQFQHSSFLFGGRVLSAGLLKVKDGQLTSLSPLSGHYRAGTTHFRHFVTLLQEKGVDLSKVKLSKSLLMLAALEKYGQVKSKGKKKKKAKKEEKEQRRQERKESKHQRKSQQSDSKDQTAAAADNKDDAEKKSKLTELAEKLHIK